MSVAFPLLPTRTGLARWVGFRCLLGFHPNFHLEWFAGPFNLLIGYIENLFAGAAPENYYFVDLPILHVNQLPQKVILTRRRWDAYMLPFFLAAAAIGILRVWQTGQFQFAFAPVAVIPFWLMLRLQTPRNGMEVTSIRSTPGAVVLLLFMAATLISMTLLVVIDIYFFKHPFRSPLEPYHAALFTPPFIIMFTGAYWADRIAKAMKGSGCTHGAKDDSA